jgi:hypothetical protein
LVFCTCASPERKATPLLAPVFLLAMGGFLRFVIGWREQSTCPACMWYNIAVCVATGNQCVPGAMVYSTSGRPREEGDFSQKSHQYYCCGQCCFCHCNNIIHKSMMHFDSRLGYVKNMSGSNSCLNRYSVCKILGKNGRLQYHSV